MLRSRAGQRGLQQLASLLEWQQSRVLAGGALQQQRALADAAQQPTPAPRQPGGARRAPKAVKYARERKAFEDSLSELRKQWAQQRLQRLARRERKEQEERAQREAAKAAKAQQDAAAREARARQRLAEEEAARELRVRRGVVGGCWGVCGLPAVGVCGATATLQWCVGVAEPAPEPIGVEGLVLASAWFTG